MYRGCRVLPELQDYRVHRESEGRPGFLESRDLKGYQARQVRKVFRDFDLNV